MLTFNEIKINKSRLSLPLLFVSNVFDSNVLFVLVEEFVATFVNEQFGAPIECDFFFYLVIIFSNKTGQKKEEEENEGMKSPGNWTIYSTLKCVNIPIECSIWFD